MEHLGAFLDILSIMTAAAFLFALSYNLAFLFTRIIGILTHKFGKLWVYGAPGFASFLIFVEIPLLTLISHKEDALYILIFSGFLIVAIAFLLYYLPVFSGMNAAILFMSSVFTRILLLPFETMADDIFSHSYLIFQVYLLLGVILFYMLLQIRYRYHLTPYYERFRVPRYALVAVLLVWAVIVFASWFQSYPYSLDEKIFYISPFIQSELKGWSRLFPVNILLLSLTVWLFFSWNTNVNYRRRMKKNSFKVSFLSFLIVLAFFSLSLFTLASSFPWNSRISKINFQSGLSRELLSSAGYLMDSDGDMNSSWPGGDPDDNDSCIRIDYNCAPDDRKTAFVSGRQEERIENAKGRKKIVLITLVSSIQEGADKVVLRSDSPERNLYALFHELNGMDEYRGVQSRSFISEMAELGYRTICGGFTGANGYLSSKGEKRLDSGCQVFIADESLLEYGMRDHSPRSTIQAMGRVYKKYKEDYTFVWIHYDFNEKNKENSISDFEKMNIFPDAKNIHLIMDLIYGELKPAQNIPEEWKTQFSLRKLIYNSMNYDPYQRSFYPGPIVVSEYGTESLYASQIYVWRKKNKNLYPARTVVYKNGLFVIKDLLTGVILKYPY